MIFGSKPWLKTWLLDAFGGLRCFFVQKTLTRMDQCRLCIRSDQGLISEDKEKCVSGTCRILFRAKGSGPKAKGSGNDVSLP